jgi:hypothetical protein
MGMTNMAQQYPLEKPRALRHSYTCWSFTLLHEEQRVSIQIRARDVDLY